MIDSTTIGAIGTAIIAPIIGYLKVNSDRKATADKRDSQTVLFDKRLHDVEDKVLGIEELKESINRINVTLARIQTILEMYLKQNEFKG